MIVMTRDQYLESQQLSVDSIKITLFSPKSKKDLRRLYPELEKIKEFDKLENWELQFVWCFSCKLSPHYDNTNFNSKVMRCIEDTMPGRIKADGSTINLFKSNNFPERIRQAMKRMEQFNPDLRLIAKTTLVDTLAKYQKVLNTDLDSSEFMNKDGNVDWSKKKAYIDTTAKVRQELPGLITDIENGFGIQGDEKMYGKVSLNDYLKSKRS